MLYIFSLMRYQRGGGGGNARARRGGAFCYTDDMEHLQTALKYYINTVHGNAVGLPIRLRCLWKNISSVLFLCFYIQSKSKITQWESLPSTPIILQLLEQFQIPRRLRFPDFLQSLDPLTYSTGTTLCKNTGIKGPRCWDRHGTD